MINDIEKSKSSIYDFCFNSFMFYPWNWKIINVSSISITFRGRLGPDRMTVGFTITCTISAYHQHCEFESCSGEVYLIQYFVIKFVSDLWLVFSGYSGFLHQQNWLPRYNWNIVESGVKHHKPAINHRLYSYYTGKYQKTHVAFLT